jgi:peptide/nickel transport system permease protein
MRSYLIRRLLFAVVLVFISTIISFTILKLSPGQAGPDITNPRLSKEYIAEQQRLFGLDRSPVSQYLSWLGVLKLIGKDDRGGLLQGDLGLSIQYKQPVATVIKSRLWATLMLNIVTIFFTWTIAIPLGIWAAVIKSRLWATLMLNIVTIFFTWTIAIPLGIWAAVRQYKWPDKVLSLLGFTGMSMPGFFMALVILWLLASKTHVLPPGGLASIDHDKLSFAGRMADYARHLAVPVLVLTFGALAGLQRFTRGNMLEVLREQYITTARAKGLNENRVIYKHALRNAVNPLVTMLGFEFAGLFGGAALLENVINYPGMGQLILEALRAKDQCLVMSTFLIGSIMLVLGNLLAEILLAWVDPRVSYS